MLFLLTDLCSFNPQLCFCRVGTYVRYTVRVRKPRLKTTRQAVTGTENMTHLRVNVNRSRFCAEWSSADIERRLANAATSERKCVDATSSFFCSADGRWERMPASQAASRSDKTLRGGNGVSTYH